MRDRPRAPRDWTREAYPTGNGNAAGQSDDSKRGVLGNGRARVYPSEPSDDGKGEGALAVSSLKDMSI